MNMVRATIEALPAILNLARRVSFSSLQKDQLAHGFLFPYPEEKYREFVRLADHFYVLYEAGTLIAFVLAHTSEKSDFFGHEEIYDYIASIKREPFLVVRQVCVDPNYSNKGYGRKLYEDLFSLLKDDHTHKVAIAFIWERPPNVASEKFHKALGWRKIDTYSLKNGDGIVGIWERRI